MIYEFKIYIIITIISVLALSKSQSQITLKTYRVSEGLGRA